MFTPHHVSQISGDSWWRVCYQQGLPHLVLIFLYLFIQGLGPQRTMTQFEEKEHQTLTVMFFWIPSVLIWIPYLFVRIFFFIYELNFTCSGFSTFSTWYKINLWHMKLHKIQHIDLRWSVLIDGIRFSWMKINSFAHEKVLKRGKVAWLSCII